MKLESMGVVADQSSEAIRQLAVREFLGASTVAPELEFYQIDGNADTPRNAQGSMTSGGTRAIGSAFGSIQTNTPSFGSLSLVIYGGEVNTDAAYIRRGRSIGDQRSSDLVKHAQSLGRYISNAVFNHTGATISGNPSITGLQKLSGDASRDVIFDSAGDGVLPTGNGNTERKKQQAFLEFMDAAIEDMSGTGKLVIWANSAMKSRLKSVGREFISTASVLDIFGNPVSVDSYNNIPIINPKYAQDNSTLILPITETVILPSTATRSNTCSMYLTIFGEESDIACASNVGLHVIDNGKVKSQFATTCEIDMAMALLNTKAIKRLKGFAFA